MAIVHNAIRKALRNRLMTINASFFVIANVAWENRPFNPPTESLWIRETYLPNLENLVATNQVQAVGIVEYAVFYPLLKGTERAEEVAEAIKALFKPASDVAGFIAIDRSERERPRIEDPWWVVPVSISWRTYSTNT
jgi:hypothetical protein